MSPGPEKKHGSHEKSVVIKENDNNDQEVLCPEVRRVAERRLVRRLDFRLLLAVVIIYVMNYIDRVAISSARLNGLQTDLGISDIQYDTVVAILYVSYCPAQVPSNMVLNYISRPSFYIGTCAILWGLTSVLTGITKDFTGIMACRVFIGLPEAAFYPGSMYLLSTWYTRKELALRSAILLSGSLISNAFGSLWAAGILSTMNGVKGIPAWRWLFFIEGAVTMFIGFLAMWLLPDYPTNTRWLTTAERRLAQIRLAEDVGEADQDSRQAPFSEGLKLALKDLKVLIFMLMFCSQLLGLSFINFFPTLTATLGYSTTNTLLMAAPPWVFVVIAAIINARHADITGERFFHLTSWLWVVVVGYVISLSTVNTAARYFSIFLLVTGYCGSTLTFVWVANSVPRPPAKRAAAISLVNGFGNIGNLAGSYVWQSKWGPEYHPSMVIALCALAFSVVLCFVIRMLLVRENRRTEREELDVMHGPERERVEEAAKLEGITLDEAVRRRMRFRYLY